MNPTEAQPNAGKSVLITVLLRVMMLGILIGSIALVWWSVDRLARVNRQIKETSGAAVTLGNEVQRLEMALNPTEVALADKRYRAAQESLSGAPEESGTWNDILQEQALEMSLRATVQLGQVQMSSPTNLALSSRLATLELHPLLEGPQTNIPYRNLMFFSGLLEKPNWRIDLLDLHVQGNSNSVRQATALVQLWSPMGKL